MVLYEDSRQQDGRHKNIHEYCKKMGITIVRQKLEVGDYMIDPTNGKISVDSKMDLLELSGNICSSDHRRFRAECERSKAMGIQLVFLIEEVPMYGKVDFWEVPVWTSNNQYHRKGEPMTLVDPQTLRKAMMTMVRKYGIRFEFCTKDQTPERVIKILKGAFR